MKGYFDNIPEGKLKDFKDYMITFFHKTNILDSIKLSEPLNAQFLDTVFKQVIKI